MEKTEAIKQQAEELLKVLDLNYASVGVREAEEKAFRVEIEGENLGILIGFHGENLASFQIVLGLLLAKKLGEWVRVVVDVGGYRTEREEHLRELATRTAERARFLDSPITLSPMPAHERRMVHMAVAEIPGVASESVGEGWERRVVIKPDHEENPKENTSSTEL
ncbi:MAG: R3H domain-containing nucleic acid-binding protein [bacterium]|nr:R3H domain-containing nucleic acid-binding protein [bacterium]